MDFRFGETQTMLRDLAREILEKEVTLEHLKELEASDAGFSAGLWSRLAEANLLGLAVPEALGGMGFGVLELCVLLEEAGRTVAPVPLLASLVMAGLPLAELGTDAQKEAWLAPMAKGEAVLSAALGDAAADADAAPTTSARPDGSRWILDGCERAVPAADRASRILIPAETGGGVGLFLVDPGADGVQRTRQATSTGEPLFELQLAGARVDASGLLGGRPDAGAAALARIRDCATVGVCASQIGVSERALEITTAYVKEREQFGAPIGSFPVVQHRCADAYIDLECMRWTTWRAAWKLGEGMPASRETAVAKFWAAEAGSRIANSAQHLHGGIGVDRDYPIHRYFLRAKSLELCLGAAMPQLVRLGRDMARTGPQEPQ